MQGQAGTLTCLPHKAVHTGNTLRMRLNCAGTQSALACMLSSGGHLPSRGTANRPAAGGAASSTDGRTCFFRYLMMPASSRGPSYADGLSMSPLNICRGIKDV